MSVIEQDSTVDLAGMRAGIVARLKRFRAQVRVHMLAEGVARVVGMTVALALLSLILDRRLKLHLGTRIGFLIPALAVIGHEIWRWIIAPLRAKLGLLDLTTALDRKRLGSVAITNVGSNGDSALSARVATVMELPSLLTSPTPPSRAFVEQAVQRSHEALAELDFSKHLNRARLRKMLGAIALALFVPALLTVVYPSAMKLWAKRWLMGSNEPWPQRTHLQVAGLEDGRIVVPRGEPFVLRVSAAPGSEAPAAVSVRFREGRGERISGGMNQFRANDFRYDFVTVVAPIRVEVWGGDDELEPFEIAPVDRPKIVQLQLTSQHPTQEKPETHAFGGEDAETSFLPRTALELTFTANVPVSEVHLKNSQATPSDGDLRRLDERTFAVKWTHDQAVQLQIESVSASGNLASLPLPVSIGLKVDQAPKVTIGYTGVRLRVTPMAHIPLTINVRDDYGIARVDLNHKVEMPDPADPAKMKATTSTVNLMPTTRPAKELDIQLQRQVDVAEFKLSPGAMLSLTGAATDACYLGPQTGQSRAVTFKVVAPEELFKEILLRQQAERGKFRKATDEAEKMRDALQIMVTPESQQQVIRQHRALQREVLRIHTAFSESLLELKLNGLGSPEAYEMMEKNILSPMKKLHDELMVPQREALESIGQSSSNQTLADATARQEQIVERMKEILKQMAQWDSFVDVLNQLNDIIRQQTKINQQTDQMKSKQTEGLFDK
ncbi:MAG: hypothetical protein ACHRHE_20685 [Tepidisphaerales bacterium]